MTKTTASPMQPTAHLPASYSHFTRLQLAQLGRELMLAAQFNSRAGYAALRMNHGEDAYRPVAIENWIAASPIYTQRMQRAMGFDGGDDVATIFKGLQLECGFTHQYFDAHFSVDSPTKGRFWLASCGALLEAEPRGDQAVVTMCHDIEDPTFDATAVATNPRARMRPVHRPPRGPGASGAHCEWCVEIDAQAMPLQEAAATVALRASQLATLSIDRPDPQETGGMAYYDGPLLEQLHLEQLSHAALCVVCAELAIQNQLLVTAMMMAIERHYSTAAALAVAEFQMQGSAWIVSERLARWLGCTNGGIEAIERVLAVHPALAPRPYFSLRFEQHSATRATLILDDSPAWHEQHGLGWQSLLRDGRLAGLAGLLRGVDARATVSPTEGPGLLNFEVSLEPEAAATEQDSADVDAEPLAVQITKGTVLYQTQLEDRIALLNV